MDSLDIRSVACVGGGLIGASWAALFAAHGMDVRVYDPDPSAESTLTRILGRACKVLGKDVTQLRQQIQFTTDLAVALNGVQFVQESGPENLATKQSLYRHLCEQLAPEVIIASSTSNISMSDVQQGCRHPERTIVGHPINPPYAVPLVEVVSGVLTTPATVSRTLAFYKKLDRRPLAISSAAYGFVANRLQSSLIREAFRMVMSGEATVAQVDAALMDGIGIRWAAVGVFGAVIANLPSGKTDEWLRFFESTGFGDKLVHDGPFNPWTAKQRELIAAQWESRIAAEGPDQLVMRRDSICAAVAGLILTWEREHRL